MVFEKNFKIGEEKKKKVLILFLSIPPSSFEIKWAIKQVIKQEAEYG